MALRRNYELVFSRAGYNTQSFVVTPPEDGSPVAIDVELQPAVGAIAGVVRSASGPLGGVTLVATDGDLVFSTTSSTDAGTLGEFSFNGLTTPAVYTVTVTRAGFGTEVVQFDLAAGQQRAGEAISMRGRCRHDHRLGTGTSARRGRWHGRAVVRRRHDHRQRR